MARKKVTNDDDVSSTKVVKTTPKTETQSKVATKETKMAENTIISLDMNLEDYADFENLPNGSYAGECTVAEVRTSDKGNQYFYTMWKIDPSEYPADYEVENAPEGLVMNFSRIQVPTAGDRRSITSVKKFMSAMGLKLKTNTIDPSTFVGKKAKLVVTTEEYNGENRNSIRSVESLDA
jgi:hypothetical protein